MRNKFADTLNKISLEDDKICALVADISPAGSMVEFRKNNPDKFINCGVAEQAMIGLAAGLAMEGFKPFCYTISTFSLFRPYEMIRVDLCYQNLPVTIIGMGAGLVYSTLGATHQTYEDIAVTTALPNMQVLAPCDPLEMEKATEWCAKESKSPVYMRLGKAGEPNLTEKALDKFEVGKLRYLKKGKDYAFISYGTIVNLSFELDQSLQEDGFNNSIISCHTLKPLDRKGIIDLLLNHKDIVCIEEHVKNGGLGEKIKLISFEEGIKSNIFHYHLKDEFIHFYGSHAELLKKHNIDTQKIKKEISHK
tara:strand:- start:352 stop:1272 length:921 start_codon:yes stop_codon:yes gene_type:complete